MRRLAICALFMFGCGENQLVVPELPDLSQPGPAPGALGSPCTSDLQCSFGVCNAIGRCSHMCPFPTCEAGWQCVPEGARNVCECPAVAGETCNGIDDDCNGIVDDNVVCPNGGACIAGKCECTGSSGPNHLKLVAKQILLPQQRTDFAVDLNGDGKVDNQYGNILGALAAQGSSPQTDVDMQVMNGQILLLVDVQSSDSAFRDDVCAGAVAENAQSQSAPNFNGNGTFTVDTSLMAGHFAGPIAQSAFLSAAPATATTPVSMQVHLPLAIGAPPTVVNLTAAQLKYNGASKQGQINGVIRKADVDAANANAAVLIDQRVQADPASQQSQQLLSIFDTGGQADPACGQTCRNPDGSCAKQGDGHISICEVTTNSIIKNVFAPDLDMFDANGNYAPNPANTDKDSLSVGFGFVATTATF